MAGYKFDECNDSGNIFWYSTDAYSPRKSLKEKMFVISSACDELRKSKLDYVDFYLKNHNQIPTWIMFKAINSSTFIDVIECSKTDVSHSLCNLYGLLDKNGHPSVKLLIGSLHWMRKVRNACAHNERVYCITRRPKRQETGRIIENFLPLLGRGYTRDLEQKLFDLVVYFKYYLPKSEYKQFISKLKAMLLELQSKIHPHAFEYVRGQIGIKNLNDLDVLLNLPKDEIEYNTFG